MGDNINSAVKLYILMFIVYLKSLSVYQTIQLEQMVG
jgi:hypothetical protein